MTLRTLRLFTLVTLLTALINLTRLMTLARCTRFRTFNDKLTILNLASLSTGAYLLDVGLDASNSRSKGRDNASLVF